jgi:hypothetical protein
MTLCKYSNILGEAGKGIHSYRIFNLAIVDVLSTIVTAKLTSDYFKVSFWKTLIIIFILGIIAHRLFCVRTTIDRLLF